MTNEQWNSLLSLIDGKKPQKPPIGLIIDCPWLPGWYNCKPIDYFGSYDTWFKANLKAIKSFPEVTFLPGFWSEYGEISEPSAFGTKTTWGSENLPHAHQIISSTSEMDSVKKPNVETDGLLPLIINKLEVMEPAINAEGHQIKFAITRGPFNIASFLMGTSEFLIAMMMEPEKTHRLLQTIADFSVDWLQYQKKCFPSIEGIMVLDDLVGFVGEPECSEFVAPYLKEIFAAFDCPVKFFHNDADGLIIGQHLEDIGVNLFNFAFKHSMNEMREACGEKVVLLGNIPPRDILAAKSPEEIKQFVRKTYEGTNNLNRIMWSCGGGVPQGVSSENMKAFVEQLCAFY